MNRLSAIRLCLVKPACTSLIETAIFHVYGRHFVFRNGRPYANFQKKIPNNYFGSHYKYLGHKYIVIQ